LRGRRGIGRWVGWALGFGYPLLLEALFLLIPHTALRGRLIEDKADGEGDFRGHPYEQDETLSPQLASTFFVAQFIERGQGLDRFGVRLVGIVEPKRARGAAMVS
jgi:hypothetical protein